MLKRMQFLCVLATSLLLTGCGSWLMPYKDEFRCNKGIGDGICSSMTENYRVIQLEENTKKQQANVEQNSTSGCKLCEDMAEATWLKQRELEKKLERK